MNNKNVCYYYAQLDKQRHVVYRCLINDDDKIKEINALDFTNTKNYRLNDKYTANDKCLFQFREDLIKHNDEIKSIYFKTKEKKNFTIDIFNSNTTMHAVYNNVLMNSDQKTINQLPNINFREFCVMQSCKTSGLMTINKSILEKTIDCFGYDYAKFYYQMMRKIRIPTSAPEYYILAEINFDKLDFGIYRCKVLCSDPLFWNIFNSNATHHYTHNTLKQLYKHKDKYNITFELLEPDDEYSYNFVWYEHSIELKVLLKGWFKVIDTLLKKCDKDNWLVKTYVSQAWGTLSKYKKTYINRSEVSQYNWDWLQNLDVNDKHDLYAYECEHNVYSMISAKNPFHYGALARIKIFLPEYGRMYIFNMISANNLAGNVIRLQTDGICFNKEITFTDEYAPIKEKKTTGKLKFHNVNCYEHTCDNCGHIWKYEKKYVHKCV